MKLTLSPTQFAFVLDGLPDKQGVLPVNRHEVVALVGPQGEGKTYGGGARLLAQAIRRPKSRLLRGALIRDTGVNIEQHTIPSLRAAFGAYAQIRALRAGGWCWQAPRMECLMFGIDDLPDLNRLQGADGWDFLWLEEPAPVIGGASAGLREEVFSYGYGRLRGGGTKWVQITMNPAEEAHWTHRLLESERPEHVKVWNIPGGENRHLSAEDRERVIRAFADRPDLAARYVRGEWGTVLVGEPATPEYRAGRHFSSQTLTPLPGVQALRGWDGWHHPSLVVMQRTPRGRVLVLDVLRGDRMGMRQFINVLVKPLLNSPRYRGITTWRDVGDETMLTPDQSDTSVTTAGVVNELLGAAFEGVSNRWEPRREAMRTMLTQDVDGDPMVRLSSTARLLHQALNGGWHYAKSQSGIVGRLPMKTPESHPGDAFSYGAVTLCPWLAPIAQPTYTAKPRALSYAGR